MTVLAPGIRFVDLRFAGTPQVIATAVFDGAGGVALVDPGPTSTLPVLEEELARGGVALSDVDTILLTHIHLDHAGATGTLVAAHPRIRVYVHERGARHMIDPVKLLSSAARVYGDRMDALWGAFLPVPATNIVALGGGEEIRAGGRTLEVAYTPGHASHHVAYFDRESGLAFVGDVAGVRIPPTTFVLPPTPPPDIDLDTWRASVERLLAWYPHGLFLTHFGLVSTPAPHLEELLTRLDAYAEIARQCLTSGGDEPSQRARFVAAVMADMKREVGEAAAARYALGVPPYQCWQGLARYWTKKMSA